MTFENYLQETHAEQYVGHNDYMLTDFDDWLLEMDVCEWLNHGQDYGCLLQKQLIEEQTNEALKRLQQALKEREENF